MIIPKPVKFGLSIGLLLATVIPILSILDVSSRTRAAITWTLVATMAVELIAISLQAVRGTPSHFNTSTRFDTLIWNLMLVAIVIAFVALVAFAILVTTRSLDCDPLVATAIRIGAWLLLLTAVSGFAMGGRNQHTVGGVDGAGQLLPVTGWSREYGDLRVPHFFAMHAIQALPLVGLAVSRLGERARVVVFGTVAVLWIAISIGTLIGAFAGRPLLRGDV